MILPLLSLSNILKSNKSNVNKMSGMLYECIIYLSSLPDISKWNTSNATNMSYLFCESIKLSSFLDISK